MKLYSILDKATGQYNNPFTQPTDGSAVRAIRNEMEQPDSMLRKHPTDFELWRVGEFDQETGYITPQNERVVSLFALTQENGNA